MNFMDIVRHRGRCTKYTKYYPPYNKSPQNVYPTKVLCVYIEHLPNEIWAHSTQHIYKYILTVQNIYVLRYSRILLYVRYAKYFWRTFFRTSQSWFILWCFTQAKIKILTWTGNLRCFSPTKLSSPHQYAVRCLVIPNVIVVRK